MSKMAVDRAHSWAWAMADVKVSLPLCPARMLNASGICAKLELICVRLVLRMCVRVSGRDGDCMSRRGGYGGLGYIVIARPTWSAVRGVAGADRSRTILPNSWPNWCRHAVACSVPLRTAYGRPRQAGGRGGPARRCTVRVVGSRGTRAAGRTRHDGGSTGHRAKSAPPRAP